MSLRRKFHVLLAIFGVSVAANVVVSVWCIRVYVDTVTNRFHVFTADVQRTDVVRTLLDELVGELETRARRAKPLDDARHRILCQRIVEQVAELPSAENGQPGGEADARSRLLDLGRRLSDRSEQYMSLLADGRREEAAGVLSTAIGRECVSPMRQALAEVTRQSNTSITRTAATVAQKQDWVTAILSLNALAVFLLVAVVVHLVRYWMLKPMDALKTATERHAAGDLEYRIPEHSSDELGVLSRQVNWMANSLAAIQRRMIEQERLAAVGELASSIAHNIRNPLANIRASVQSTMNEYPANGTIRARHAQVIETVDSLNRWVRELLLVNKPIELECRPVEVRELVDRVVAVTRDSAETRGIRIEVDESLPGCVVRADASRVEQALLVVVNNAVEASPPNTAVRVAIRKPAETPEQVKIHVTDSGPGIPAEIRHRIGSPYFSTKLGGTGIGLHLAKRVATAHGGTLDFQDNPDGGTTVTLSLSSSPGEQIGVERPQPTRA